MTNALKHRGPDEEGYVFINANNRKEYECCNRSTQMKDSNESLNSAT